MLNTFSNFIGGLGGTFGPSFFNLIALIINLIDVLIIILPILLSVAFMTIIERKQLAAMQRRVGPNTTGFYGVLQPLSLTSGYFYD